MRCNNSGDRSGHPRREGRWLTAPYELIGLPFQAKLNLAPLGPLNCKSSLILHELPVARSSGRVFCGYGPDGNFGHVYRNKGSRQTTYYTEVESFLCPAR
jgi:hypothetical protein